MMETTASETGISVIVPVYNAEEYIDRCVSSILCNEENDFEILLIDDGSTDGSGKKCDDWSLKDARIRVFHKSNGGVSSARNLGLDNARGRWIAFVDADDEVSTQFLTIPEELSGSDVILKSFIERTSNGDNSFGVPEADFRGRRQIMRWFVRRRNNALWDKLIRKDAIGELRFDTAVSIGEDLLFFASVIPHISRISICALGNYIYIRRQSSAMAGAKQANRLDEYIYNSENIISKCNDNKMPQLGRCITAQLYIPLIVRNMHLLTSVQTRRFNKICRKINIFNLSYLSVRDRLRYTLAIVRFRLKL